MASNCPKCSARFCPPLHLPLILPSCLHHLCSSCVTCMRETGSGNVQCYVTDCTVLITEVDEKVLVPDHHLIGYLTSSEVNQGSKEEKSDNEVQFVHSTNANFNSMTCFMCSNISQVTCTSCPMSFCSGECFKQLHSTPALASHELKHNDLSQVCKEHGKEIVFLAVEDLQLGCPECFSLGELDCQRLVSFSSVVNEMRNNEIMNEILNNAYVSMREMSSANKSLTSILQSEASSDHDN